MTRGNQRDVDRARAAARKEKAVPKGKKGGSVIERNEHDAVALAAKIAAKKAAEESGFPPPKHK